MSTLHSLILNNVQSTVLVIDMVTSTIGSDLYLYSLLITNVKMWNKSSPMTTWNVRSIKLDTEMVNASLERSNVKRKMSILVVNQLTGSHSLRPSTAHG